MRSQNTKNERKEKRIRKESTTIRMITIILSCEMSQSHIEISE
jgi:hypothetical protein